jgi:TetR/AcrR family transcriptional regulator, transcriptional repressor for nem operon
MDTRTRILTAMFKDVRLNGYQGLRADKVIADLGVTKGAMYHYFPNKQQIGLAIIEEVLSPDYISFYVNLDQSNSDPIPLLQEHLRWLASICDEEEAVLGCPLNNLVQEMSPLDEIFRKKLLAIIQKMQSSVKEALQRGQTNGFLKLSFDCDTIAWYYLSTLEGAYSMAKVSKSNVVYKRINQQLVHFLESLRM